MWADLNATAGIGQNLCTFWAEVGLAAMPATAIQSDHGDNRAMLAINPRSRHIELSSLGGAAQAAGLRFCV